MRAVVAGDEVQRINEARRILLSEGLTCEAQDAVGYDRLQDSLAAGRLDVVLVYCNGGDEGLAAIRAANRLVAVPVLAVGEPDVAHMREALRAGAREYLDVNNLRHDLAAAWRRSKRPIRSPANGARSSASSRPSAGPG